MSRFGGLGELPRGGERWDPERFGREREQRYRGPAVIERDRYEEIDRYDIRSPPRRDRSADAFFARRPSAPYEEKDRFVFEERYGPPARRPAGGPGRYYDEEIIDYEASSSRGGKIVPFERRVESVADRSYGSPVARGGPRPRFIRRQSSLDTFDRKPMPRYGDRLREPPETIALPSRPRRRSPPRFVGRDYVERDYEEIRVAEPEFYGDEEFRGYTEREISTVRKRHGGNETRERDIIEEREEIIEKPYPRKGKTKMPMRLVNRRAVIELGYPFEEEGETLIILKALGKEHIDEVIKISREMNSRGATENRTTYMIESTEPASNSQPQIVERRTEIITERPAVAEVPRSVREWDVMSNKSEKRRSPSPKSHRNRHRSASSSIDHRRNRSASSSSTHRELIIEQERGESSSVAVGIGALIIPERRVNRDERSIKAEIRALEAEKKALRLEREMEKDHRRGDRHRDSDLTIERDREVVKIEKDRKAPNPRIIKAMLATLT